MVSIIIVAAQDPVTPEKDDCYSQEWCQSYGNGGCAHCLYNMTVLSGDMWCDGADSVKSSCGKSKAMNPITGRGSWDKPEDGLRCYGCEEVTLLDKIIKCKDPTSCGAAYGALGLLILCCCCCKRCCCPAPQKTVVQIQSAQSTSVAVASTAYRRPATGSKASRAAMRPNDDDDDQMMMVKSVV